MKLAQIYEIMNEKQLALDLVNQGKSRISPPYFFSSNIITVIKAREQNQSRILTSEPNTPVDASLFAERTAPNPSSSTNPKKPTIKPAEAQRTDRERTDAVQRGFKTLAVLDAGEVVLAAEEMIGRWDEWVEEADGVARIFMEEKKLFVVDRVSALRMVWGAGLIFWGLV